MRAWQTLTFMGVGIFALLVVVVRGGSEAPAQGERPAAEATAPTNDSASRPAEPPEPVAPAFQRRWVAGDDSFLAVWPEKQRDLAARRKWRAFLGAPPVIPHKLEKLDLCGNCHDVGNRLGEGIARMRPHSKLISCTQCHVEELNQRFGAVVDSPSTFWGQPEPLGGPRAFIGAPPAIPHATAMRTKCLACHGQFGLPAIRTPHPERADCRQCHVRIAAIDRKP